MRVKGIWLGFKAMKLSKVIMEKQMVRNRRGPGQRTREVLPGAELRKAKETEKGAGGQ